MCSPRTTAPRSLARSAPNGCLWSRGGRGRRGLDPVATRVGGHGGCFGEPSGAGPGVRRRPGPLAVFLDCWFLQADAMVHGGRDGPWILVDAPRALTALP